MLLPTLKKWGIVTVVSIFQRGDRSNSQHLSHVIFEYITTRKKNWKCLLGWGESVQETIDENSLVTISRNA